MKRVNLMAGALVIGIGLAGLSAPAAFASQAAATQAASVPSADYWFEGGSYPTFYDCSQGGQQALRTGFAQYRCDPVYAPDGAIAYWQLWIEYP